MARPPADDDEGFLSRWSRRKQQVRETEPELESEERPAESAAADPDDPNRPLTPEEVEALPDPDTLEPGADFKRFLREGVPEELKRRALRRLWRSNPVFGVLDGLNDYDLDYTDAATVVANLRTAFKVGRGIVLPEEEEAERKAAEKTEDSAETSNAEGANERTEAESENAESAAGPRGETATDKPDPAGADRAAQVEPEPGPARLPRLTPFAPDPLDGAPRPAEAVPSERAKGRAVQRRWGGFARDSAEKRGSGSGRSDG